MEDIKSLAQKIDIIILYCRGSANKMTTMIAKKYFHACTFNCFISKYLSLVIVQKKKKLRTSLVILMKNIHEYLCDYFIDIM